MPKKLPTIKLQGKDYVQVDTRVTYFNETYTNGRITTKPTFNENTVYFEATITPDVEKPDRKFTGHSFGVLGKEKALEKLETVAVGRALAFMGIGIVEGIASADEMANFQNKEPERMERPGVCNVCGQVGMKAKTKTGRVFMTCPDWKEHKENKQKFEIVFPDKMTEEQKKVSKELDEIPIPVIGKKQIKEDLEKENGK